MKDSKDIDELFKFDMKKKLLRQNKRRKGLHLIILVHGFQGSSFDLRYYKDYISQLYPNTIFLSSTQNEDKMDTGLDAMGLILANEIKEFISNFFRSSFDVLLEKISFIAFSLGAVIVRSALRFLED
mmetsp:Transcript_32699/g.27612  ORF Transcript_32699/g.27612 Transcript_32699/m.27612 type:complete len:127 (-) Transcript_32699:530-910(-)